MSLPWIRLDTSMPDNPKILGLETVKDGHRAAFMWLKCMCYAGKHGTAGFVPREAIPRLGGRMQDMAVLTEHGFITECAGGWDIHGWAEFQVADDAATKRRDKAKRAAAIRWSKAAVTLPEKGA